MNKTHEPQRAEKPFFALWINTIHAKQRQSKTSLYMSQFANLNFSHLISWKFSAQS